MKKIMFIVYALLSIGAGCSAQPDSNQPTGQQDQIQSQQEIIDQQKAALENLEKKVAELEKKSNTQEKQISTPPPPPKAPSENLDLILTNYKIDAQDNDDVYETLLNAAYNSPSQLCPSIIANRTTRQNVYYMVIDGINGLESKYGTYKNNIEYIGNNLPGLWDGIEIVKDQCESIGYNIQ